MKCVLQWTCLLLLLVSAHSSSLACYESPSLVSTYRSTFASCGNARCGRIASCTEMNPLCQSCPRGSISDGWVCIGCRQTISEHPYALSYLTSIPLVLFALYVANIFSGHSSASKCTIFTIFAAIELAIASVAATITLSDSNEPFSLTLCPVSSVSDFYTPFSSECNSEAALPLVSWPLTMIAFAVLASLLIRLPIALYYSWTELYRTIYLSLAQTPLYFLFVLIFGGVQYRIFPWLFVIVFGLYTPLFAIGVHVRKRRRLRSEYRLAYTSDIQRTVICNIIAILFMMVSLVGLMDNYQTNVDNVPITRSPAMTVVPFAVPVGFVVVLYAFEHVMFKRYLKRRT